VYSIEFGLLYNYRGFEIPLTSAQHCPPGNNIGRGSCVCQESCQLYNNLTILSAARHEPVCNVTGTSNYTLQRLK